MRPPLDNVAWHALTGAQAAHATGTPTARRYAPGYSPGYSPIVAFAGVERPDFGALAPYCEPGAPFYCSGWSGAMPDGWVLGAEATMFQLVWGAATPAFDVDAAAGWARLGPEHAAQALELATLTRPGPFGPRTIELGTYLGCFDGARLVAMAGERMHAGTWREVSGVCTHPDHQGRGLARGLVLELVRQQRQRGETPFLHVMRSNAGAHRLYERMGFQVRAEPVARVLSRARA